MNSETYNTLPEAFLAKLAPNEITIDESIPTGQVELRPSGERMPVDEFMAKRRADHKRERQNRRAGRRK